MDYVVVERAREETTTILAAMEANLATQQSTWEIERATLIVEKESEKATFVSQLEDVKQAKSRLQMESDAKEVELRNIVEMMKRALEIQMAKADPNTRT